VQIHLFTSGGNATSSIGQLLLTIAMIAELLSVTIVLFFLRSNKTHDSGSPLPDPSAAVLLAANIPIFLIVVGMLLLATALVVENFRF
jgi:uncharacterized membrane protein YidH (DUF202 family)